MFGLLHKQPNRAMNRLLRNFVVLSITALLPLFGHAQSLSPQPDPVQFIVAPEAPGPNQQVTIQIQGVGSFLGNSAITWQIDGKTVQTGIGVSRLLFTTKGIGQASRVHVEVLSDSEGLIVKDFTFVPSVVNLLWEADTSVPPLYRGKALYSPGSDIRVSAFPVVYTSGQLVSVKNISFQWYLNDEKVSDASGLGKSAISFPGSQLRKEEFVAVDLFIGNNKVGHGEVTITATEPRVVMYQRDALRGLILDKVLPNVFNLAGAEITIQAEPFYFSNSSRRDGSLEYSWTLNDNPITGPDSAKGIMTLRQTGSGGGSARLSASVQNNSSSAFTQTAQNLLTIFFGGATSEQSSFFGL